MNAIDRNWIDRDHDEATNIARQLIAAGPSITPQHIIDLNRFCDCCEDGEGYDVPLGRMRALRDVGLVSGGSFGRYQTTTLGNDIRDIWYNQP